MTKTAACYSSCLVNGKNSGYSSTEISDVRMVLYLVTYVILIAYQWQKQDYKWCSL